MPSSDNPTFQSDPNFSSSNPALNIVSSQDYAIVPGSQQAVLEIEGGQEVFYRGAYVTRIPLKNNSVLIGRRDVLAGHYPDVDLMMYRKMDPAISRKHLQVYKDINGKFFVEDLCNNNATFINDYNNKLNHDRVELKPGDRIFVSMSIALVFKYI